MKVTTVTVPKYNWELSEDECGFLYELLRNVVTKVDVPEGKTMKLVGSMVEELNGSNVPYRSGHLSAPAWVKD